MRRALITGITGQDGSFLAELLLSKGYEVHGIIRRASTFNTQRIDHIFDKLHLHYGDLLDSSSLHNILEISQPEEVYNLAGQSHVAVSFEQPAYTHDTVALGTLRLLEAIWKDGAFIRNVRFYQAGSSEMFGNSPPPQNEMTRFDPRSPYAVAKVAAHYHVCNYRERGIFACNGILFNHESERRGETFVTRKITRAVGRIKYGLQNRLCLGSVRTWRDWGYAGDYVQAMWMMLQQEKPDDYVIGTGKTLRVSAFVERAFRHAGLNSQDCVSLNEQRYVRPIEVEELCANPAKAERVLGWKAKVTTEELIGIMVDHDLKLAEQETQFAAVDTRA